MDNKKYYYMRLKEDFFDTDEMKLLEAMQDGYLYSNILLKMYLKSLKGNGKLMFNNAIPYNSQMIATVTGHQVGTVEKALEIFRQLGLIEVLESGAIYMIHIQNFIGKSNTEADRKRAYRKLIECEKNENLGQMSGQMSDKCPTNVLEMSPRDRDRDRDRDKDKDKDKDKESAKADSDEPDGSTSPSLFDSDVKKQKKKQTKHKYGEYNNVLLTDEELTKLKEKIPNWQDFIERLSGYIASTGKRYKSHYVTMLNWYRRDGQRQQAQQPQQKQETRVMCEYNNGVTDDLDFLF